MSYLGVYGEIRGFEAVTVGTAVATLTAGSLAPSGTPRPYGAFMTVRCGDGGINFRCDGGNPGSVAGSGHYVGDGSAFFVTDINSLKGFKAVRTGTADAAMAVSYLWK